MTLAEANDSNVQLSLFLTVLREFVHRGQLMRWSRVCTARGANFTHYYVDFGIDRRRINTWSIRFNVI